MALGGSPVCRSGLGASDPSGSFERLGYIGFLAPVLRVCPEVGLDTVAAANCLADERNGILEPCVRLGAAHPEETATRLTIAVVDARGDLIAMTRMEGARPTTADTAIGKAMASAMRGRPSAELSAGSALSQAFNDSTGGRLRFFQGALPVVREGYIVGAVGTSGASSQQDEDVVRAALAAVGLN